MEFLDDYSGWGNDVLYRMCSERPNHTDVDTVSSKLWLIGRAYSASIERKAGKDFNINDAAKIVIDRNIDPYIEKIRKINRPTQENINDVLLAHHVLTLALFDSTGVMKRSLASKYLHFHAPKAVFIYDSIANGRIRDKFKRMRFNAPSEYDKPYAEFCYRCLHYRDEFLEKRLGGLVTPRRLDVDLLGYWDF